MKSIKKAVKSVLKKKPADGVKKYGPNSKFKGPVPASVQLSAQQKKARESNRKTRA